MKWRLQIFNFVNSKFHHVIFLQGLQNFQNTAVFNINEQITTHIKFDNIFFCELHIFKSKILSLSQFKFIFRKDWQKGNAGILSKSFISVTYSWDILQFNFRKSLDLNLKNLGLLYWARINFFIYRTWTGKLLELPYWARIGFMIYWSKTSKVSRQPYLVLTVFWVY